MLNHSQSFSRDSLKKKKKKKKKYFDSSHFKKSWGTEWEKSVSWNAEDKCFTAKLLQFTVNLPSHSPSNSLIHTFPFLKLNSAYYKEEEIDLRINLIPDTMWDNAKVKT